MQLRTTTKSRFVSVLQSLLLSAGWGVQTGRKV